MNTFLAPPGTRTRKLLILSQAALLFAQRGIWLTSTSRILELSPDMASRTGPSKLGYRPLARAEQLRESRNAG